jgi:hypothetical protein
MTVIVSPGNSAITATPQDLITSALLELGVIAAGEPLLAQDAAWGLEKLQRQIDQWNARRELIFSVGFSLFNLTPNHSPHTIGPNGDFNVPVRPPTIVGAAFILNGGSANPVDTPIRIRDDDWWRVNPVKSLASSIVTDLYYSPDSPLGNLYFYPTCNVAAPVRLELWGQLSQAVAQQTRLGFVQGYWEGIVLDLAMRLAPSYERPIAPETREQWNRAMRIIEANNDKPPRISTNSGMPNHGSGGRPDFNFLTGLRE